MGACASATKEKEKAEPVPPKWVPPLKPFGDKKGVPRFSLREALSEGPLRELMHRYMEDEKAPESMRFFIAVERVRARAFLNASTPSLFPGVATSVLAEHMVGVPGVHALIVAYGITRSLRGGDWDPNAPPPMPRYMPDWTPNPAYVRSAARADADLPTLCNEVVELHLKAGGEEQIPVPGKELQLFYTPKWIHPLSDPRYGVPVTEMERVPPADAPETTEIKHTGWPKRVGIEAPAVAFWLDHPPPLPSLAQQRAACWHFAVAVADDVHTEAGRDAFAAQYRLRQEMTDAQYLDAIENGVLPPPRTWFDPARWYPTPFDRCQMEVTRLMGRDTWARFRNSKRFINWVNEYARSSEAALKQCLWADFDTTDPAGPHIERDFEDEPDPRDQY